jgi:hypothetical protein
MRVEFTLAIKTVSEMNSRSHWATRYRRLKVHNLAAYIGTLNAMRGHRLTSDRFKITLTRIGMRSMDSDNLASSQKGVRDGIAAALRIDDGDDRLTWVYGQEKGKRNECGVRVEITDE